MKAALPILFACTLLAPVFGQSAPAAPAATTPAPIAAEELAKRLQSAVPGFDRDLATLRTDRWKADSQSREEAQSSVLSIRRNLTYAIPELVQQLQAAPASLNANFRLYRNLNALYDTFSALAESAGAFAPKDQYIPLATDLAQLDQLRHQAADRVEQLAGAGDAELARLRSQLASTPASPKTVKKIVVDDDQARPAKKSKPAASQPSNQ
jgi:hypothetical protein